MMSCRVPAEWLYAPIYALEPLHQSYPRNWIQKEHGPSFIGHIADLDVFRQTPGLV